MADEINITLNVVYNDGTISETFTSSFTGDVSEATPNVEKKVLDIGTTNEAISNGDLTGLGLAVIKNLDDTNYLEVSTDGTNYDFRVPPGMTFPFYINDGTQLNVKFNTAAGRIQVLLIDA